MGVNRINTEDVKRGSAATRRFVCLACGWIHLTWDARCSSCLELKGLVPSTASDVAPSLQRLPALSTPGPSEEEPFLETNAPTRPHLTIAPPPTPEPEGTDLVEELSYRGTSSASTPIPISEIAEATFVRDSTALAPLDHVLGGGLVVASVILLASPPGIGKTSLTLQMLVGLRHRCLYVTGEETREQVAATARRIGAVSSRLYVLAERNLSQIFTHARAMRAQTIAIDSIQKMHCEDLGGRPGSTAQLKECTARLVHYAKTTDTALWLIGHVTSDGDIAGPKTIEHDVDAVLELSPGPKFEGNERILRCPGKNRFGPTNVAGHFELTAKGFVPIDPDGWDEKL